MAIAHGAMTQLIDRTVSALKRPLAYRAQFF
jgi:hypothetical protein